MRYTVIDTSTLDFHEVHYQDCKRLGSLDKDIKVARFFVIVSFPGVPVLEFWIAASRHGIKEIRRYYNREVSLVVSKCKFQIE